MANKKVNSGNTNQDDILNEEKMNFFEKMKKDKKYNAKVQFALYGILIFAVIVFLNVSEASVGNSINNELDEDIVNLDKPEVVEDKDLIEKINDRYEYDVNVSVTKTGGEVITRRYYGKRFDFNTIINKEGNDVNNTYYEVSDYYYVKNENGEYELVESNQIYDLIDGKYIEVEEVLKLMDKASLDHVVDNSDGFNELVYNLLVRDVVVSDKSDDVVTIKVFEDYDKLSINIDYTNLIKIFDNTIEKCEVSYEYTMIDLVEEFSVMETVNTD